MTQIVITGMGTLTHLGVGHKTLNKGTFSQSKYSPSRWYSSEASEIEIQGYVIDDKNEEIKNLMSPFNTRYMDRFAKLTVAAVANGLQDANLSINDLSNTGFIMNTTYGPWRSTNKYTKELVASGPTYASPRLFSNTVVNSAQGHVCISFQIKGPTSTLAGSSSIPYAVSLIKKGVADRIIIAGADEANDNIMEAYNQLGSPVTFGEGVGVLVLESIESASKRNATIYAEISDYSSGCEPSMRITFDDGNSESEIYEQLLSQLSFSKSSQELVVLSAVNGVKAVTLNEKRILTKLKAKYPRLNTYYPKEVYGETFGASNVLSIINAVHLLNNDDPIDQALVLNSEIGGNHMALILKNYKSEVD